MGKLNYVLAQLEAQRKAPQQKVEAETALTFAKAGQTALGSVIQQAIASHLGPFKILLQKEFTQVGANSTAAQAKVDAIGKAIADEVSETYEALAAQVSQLEERLITVIQSIPAPKEPKMPKAVDLSPVMGKLDAISKAVGDIPLSYDIEFPEPEERKMIKRLDINRDRNGFADSIEVVY